MCFFLIDPANHIKPASVLVVRILRRDSVFCVFFRLDTLKEKPHFYWILSSSHWNILEQCNAHRKQKPIVKIYHMLLICSYPFISCIFCCTYEWFPYAKWWLLFLQAAANKSRGWRHFWLLFQFLAGPGGTWLWWCSRPVCWKVSQGPPPSWLWGWMVPLEGEPLRDAIVFGNHLGKPRRLTRIYLPLTGT